MQSYRVKKAIWLINKAFQWEYLFGELLQKVVGQIHFSDGGAVSEGGRQGSQTVVLSSQEDQGTGQLRNALQRVS